MPGQDEQAACQVHNIFKSKDKKERSSLVTIKMAQVICRTESNETVKLSVSMKSKP